MVDVIYSPDDRGWYVERWDGTTGKTLHTTRVYATRREAIKADQAMAARAALDAYDAEHPEVRAEVK